MPLLKQIESLKIMFELVIFVAMLTFFGVIAKICFTLYKKNVNSVDVINKDMKRMLKGMK